MKNKPLTITLVLLIITIANSFIFFSKSEIRAVEFVYIFVIGVLAGVLLMQIVISKRKNNTMDKKTVIILDGTDE